MFSRFFRHLLDNEPQRNSISSDDTDKVDTQPGITRAQAENGPATKDQVSAKDRHGNSRPKPAKRAATASSESDSRVLAAITALSQRFETLAGADQVAALSAQLREFATEAKERQEELVSTNCQALLDLHRLTSALFNNHAGADMIAGEMLKTRIEEHLATYGIVPLNVAVGARVDLKTMDPVVILPTLSQDLDKTVAKIHRQGWLRSTNQQGTPSLFQEARVDVFVFNRS